MVVTLDLHMDVLLAHVFSGAGESAHRTQEKGGLWQHLKELADGYAVQSCLFGTNVAMTELRGTTPCESDTHQGEGIPNLSRAVTPP